MNYFNQYFMRPIYGILSKKGPIQSMAVPNPFSLHNFAKGNAQVRRYASYYTPAPLRHRSRSMGGY